MTRVNFARPILAAAALATAACGGEDATGIFQVNCIPPADAACSRECGVWTDDDPTHFIPGGYVSSWPLSAGTHQVTANNWVSCVGSDPVQTMMEDTVEIADGLTTTRSY